MICPHCRVTFEETHCQVVTAIRSTEDNLTPTITSFRCPACKNLILFFRRSTAVTGVAPGAPPVDLRLAYPRGSARAPVPLEVETFDASLAADYTEACEVLPISAKAAAALGRRGVQHMIRTQLSITRATLHAEIAEVTEQKLLRPSTLRQLQAARHVGNDSAHPNVNTAGVLIDVTPEEAAWTLDVVVEMMRELFVEPIQEYRRVEDFNTKTGATKMPPPPLPRKVP